MNEENEEFIRAKKEMEFELRKDQCYICNKQVSPFEKSSMMLFNASKTARKVHDECLNNQKLE